MLQPQIIKRYASDREISSVLSILAKEDDASSQWRVGTYRYKNKSIDRPFFHSKNHEWMSWKEMIEWIRDAPYGSQRGSRRELDECIFIRGQDFNVVRVACGGWFVPTHFDNLWNIALCIRGIRIFECSAPCQKLPKYHTKRYVLKAGDAIRIPPGWWHQVSNPKNEMSILINGYDESKPESSDYLDKLYNAYWPGRALEQDSNFDYNPPKKEEKNGFDTYVAHNGHLYKDIIPFRNTTSTTTFTFIFTIIVLLSVVSFVIVLTTLPISEKSIE